MFISDHLTLDAPRRTSDGFLAVRARSARAGVYSYTGREVDPDNKHGLRDQASVNVLRDDAAVFDERSVRSFIGKPITDDHPSVPVTASNWRDHGRGVVMGAMRDGDHLAFDLVLMDADTISKVEAGKVELSNGYSAALEYGEFQAADGTKCAVRQASIAGNHVAIVDRGRAGPTCRIGDAALCDALPANMLPNLTEKPNVKTILIDGLTVDIANADTAEATIRTLLTARDTARTDLAARDTTIAARDTEIAGLKTEVQGLKDAKPTPAMLRDAAKGYTIVVDKAKAFGVAVTDAMDEGAIKRAVVGKLMGDTAKDWNDAQVDASFAVATKDAKSVVQPLGSPVVVTTDAEQTMRDSLDKANDFNSWRNKAA